MDNFVDEEESKTDEEENGDTVVIYADRYSDSDDEQNSETPPELIKTYHFGFGSFHPKCLQIFANKKFFTFLLSVFAFFLSSVISGLTSVSLTSIEKRYHLTSTAVGIIPISYDVTVTLIIIFISYFGGKSHKPRWLGASMISLGLGSLVFSSPEFLLGQYKSSSSGHYLYESCLDKRNFTSDCSSSDNFALTIFILGKVLIGIGGAPLYTVAQAYLDEIVFPKYITIHMGIYNAMGILGPAFGYGIGSAALSIYVDPWVSTTLTTSDPSWVGAWWMPFALVGVLTLLGSLPFLMFPRYLPDSYLVRRERLKEIAKTYSSKYSDEQSLAVKFKLLPVHIKRLLLNPSFVFMSVALGGIFFLVTSLTNFGPQYLETQFHLTATAAGLISGGVGISTAVFGVMGGAIIVYIFKLKGTKIALLGFFVFICAIPMSFGILLHCPSIPVAGINVPYPNSTEIQFDATSCVSNCECTSHVYEPICGSDGLTYFSPCRAGCITTLTINGSYMFSNCSCVAEGLIAINKTFANVSLDEVIRRYSYATNSQCQVNCELLIPFVIGLTALMLLVFLVQIPISYFTMRVVADDQRSLGLGLQSAILRSIGAIPGPLVFGAVFDGTCLKWEEECGRRGNCWLYDNNLLSFHTVSMVIPVMLVVSVLFLLSCLTYPKKKNSYGLVSREKTNSLWWIVGFRKNEKVVELSVQ